MVELEEIKSPTDDYFEVEDAISPDYNNASRKNALSSANRQNSYEEQIDIAKEESKQEMFIIDSPDELRGGTESFSSVGNEVKQQILEDSKGSGSAFFEAADH